MIYGPYPAKVLAVHDGDTCTLQMDLGWGIKYGESIRCRVYGINAPELKVPSGSPAGQDALKFAQTLLPVGAAVTVISHGWDKFGGRFDGSITLPDGRDFGNVMIAEGYARVML